jgi:hypothetical protein
MDLRFEEVGDINFKYRYIEVFYKKHPNPFLDIGINENKELEFGFYPTETNIVISLDEMLKIVEQAKQFYPKAVKDEGE